MEGKVVWICMTIFHGLTLSGAQMLTESVCYPSASFVHPFTLAPCFSTPAAPGCLLSSITLRCYTGAQSCTQPPSQVSHLAAKLMPGPGSEFTGSTGVTGVTGQTSCDRQLRDVGLMESVIRTTVSSNRCSHASFVKETECSVQLEKTPAVNVLRVCFKDIMRLTLQCDQGETILIKNVSCGSYPGSLPVGECERESRPELCNLLYVASLRTVCNGNRECIISTLSKRFLRIDHLCVPAVDTLTTPTNVSLQPSSVPQATDLVAKEHNDNQTVPSGVELHHNQSLLQPSLPSIPQLVQPVEQPQQASQQTPLPSLPLNHEQTQQPGQQSIQPEETPFTVQPLPTHEPTRAPLPFTPPPTPAAVTNHVDAYTDSLTEPPVEHYRTNPHSPAPLDQQFTSQQPIGLLSSQPQTISTPPTVASATASTPTSTQAISTQTTTQSIPSLTATGTRDTPPFPIAPATTTLLTTEITTPQPLMTTSQSTPQPPLTETTVTPEPPASSAPQASLHTSRSSVTRTPSIDTTLRLQHPQHSSSASPTTHASIGLTESPPASHSLTTSSSATVGEPTSPGEPNTHALPSAPTTESQPGVQMEPSTPHPSTQNEDSTTIDPALIPRQLPSALPVKPANTLISAGSTNPEVASIPGYIEPGLNSTKLPPTTEQRLNNTTRLHNSVHGDSIAATSEGWNREGLFDAMTLFICIGLLIAVVLSLIVVLIGCAVKNQFQRRSRPKTFIEGVHRPCQLKKSNSVLSYSTQDPRPQSATSADFLYNHSPGGGFLSNSTSSGFYPASSYKLSEPSIPEEEPTYAELGPSHLEAPIEPDFKTKSLPAGYYNVAPHLDSRYSNNAAS